jgi:ABC-type multidrug transport system fused ATPase/permease subunit
VKRLVPEAPAVSVRDVFRRFWPFARPLRRWLLPAFLLTAAGPALDAVAIWLFKVLIDEILVPRDFGPFVWLAAGYLGITLVRGALSFADDWLSAWLGERFVLGLRVAFFSHLQRLSLDFFDRRQLGDVLSRLTGDVAAIEAFVLSGVADAASYVLRLLFFAGALLFVDWQLALVAFVVAPLFGVTSRKMSRKMKRASRARRRLAGSITSVAEESLANIQLVQAYGGQGREFSRFLRESRAALDAAMASTKVRALFSPLVDLIELAGALVVIGLGTWKLSHGDLTLGALLVFMTYLNGLYSPIRGLTKLVNTLYSASAGAERIIEFLDERPAIREAPRPKRLERANGELRLERVGFHYPGAETLALDGVSLAVHPGETLAVVGASGAGKSTLIKLLLRFYDPTAGRILLDGHDLRALDLASLRANLAVVLQETQVFDGTVRENIAFGRPSATEDEIVDAAAAADAHEFITMLPDGYDTPVGQRGRRLSGGQRQRLAIARAMVRDAPLLVLDEPTTGLDNESSERLLEPLRRLAAGRTTVVISHNLLTVRDATRIVVLDGGRVIEEGSHDELLAAGRDYARLYHLHHGVTPLRRAA